MTNKEFYADYKWIKVKRYTMDESKSWENLYKDLDNHHLKETTFLIDEVRSLADKLDQLTEDTEKIEAKRKKKEKIAEYFRSFFVFWFGFAFIGAIVIDWSIDKQTQFEYHAWIFGGILLFGLLVSSLLTYCKFTQKGCEQ